MRAALPRARSFVRLLALLLLASAALPRCAAQPPGPRQVVVSTADELKSAFNAATPHVELQSHLDLRDAPVHSTATDKPWPYIFRSYTGLESLRVRP